MLIIESNLEKEKEYNMSLDIWLENEQKCKHCDGHGNSSETVYDGNITHNLNLMADQAGIYKHLWRPEELGITKAKELIEPLKTGLDLLLSDPERFKEFNAPNGWGSYEGLCKFVENYLKACEQNPEATIKVWR